MLKKRSRSKRFGVESGNKEDKMEKKKAKMNRRIETEKNRGTP